MSWFKAHYGFTEKSGQFRDNRREFTLTDSQHLVCNKAPGEGKKQYVGLFTTPSVYELKRLLSARALASSDLLTFRHRAVSGGVVELIMNRENEGAVFQAASQFNCLEMVGPGVSPAGRRRRRRRARGCT